MVKLESVRPRVTSSQMAAVLEENPQYFALSLFIEDLAPLPAYSQPNDDAFVFSVNGEWYELRRYESHGVAIVARLGAFLESPAVVSTDEPPDEPTGYPATGKLHGVLIGKTLSDEPGSSRRVWVVVHVAADTWGLYQGGLTSWLKTRLANDHVIAAVPTGHERISEPRTRLHQKALDTCSKLGASLRLRRRSIRCLFCGYLSEEKDHAATRDKIRAHMYVCEKHPMRLVENQRHDMEVTASIMYRENIELRLRLAKLEGK